MGQPAGVAVQTLVAVGLPAIADSAPSISGSAVTTLPMLDQQAVVPASLVEFHSSTYSTYQQPLVPLATDHSAVLRPGNCCWTGFGSAGGCTSG